MMPATTAPPAAPDAPVIEIRGLESRYGTRVIHEHLDLTVNAGEIVSIVGGSGAGKTTLLNHMMGLTCPTRGSVKVFGQPAHDLPERMARPGPHRRFGVLFQQGALFSALSVFDNVALPLRELRQHDAAAVRARVERILDAVEIAASDASKRPAELSGGMVKRVALARALALEPALLYLDEPTAGLDPALSESFVELLAQLHAERAMTVVMITHDLDTLVALSQRVAVLAERRLLVCAPLAEVVAYDHPFIQQFFLGARGRSVLAAHGVPNLEVMHGKS